MSLVDIRVEGPLGCITVTRPEALNALNLPMVQAIAKALSNWVPDPQIHMV